MIRWGILGAGGIAAVVSEDIAASKHSVLQAVAARDADRARSFARRFDIPHAYGSHDQLADDPSVDIVYVATTHAHHAAHALLALRSGKHVLVEKPFALNGSQARSIMETASRQGLFCMEAMWMRMHPLIRQASHLAESGRIGEVMSVRADLSIAVAYDRAHRLFDLEQGGGALLDLGIYPAHLAWMFLGRPSGTHASAAITPSGADAGVAMQWDYDGGRFAHLSCSTVNPSPYGAWISGTNGWISIHPPVQFPPAMTVSVDGNQDVLEQTLPGNGYGPQIAEVERCLAAGLIQSPLAPLQETVQVLDVLDAVRREIGVRYPADET